MKNTILQLKSYAFAVNATRLYQKIQYEKKEFVLSKQIVKCGTSIGANIKEAEFAQSAADFISKMNIALKEGNEAQYWLRLLRDTDYLTTVEFEALHSDCNELIAMLVSTIKTKKENESRK